MSGIEHKVQPGDLLLIRTPGRIYSLGRKLTRNAYDHVAVVINEGKTLNIVPPRAVVVPVELMSHARRAPLILRPVWKTPQQACDFVAAMGQLEGVSYALRHTLAGITLVMLRTWFGISIRMKPLPEDTQRWTCTEAILLYLTRTIPGFREIQEIPLDYFSIGFATTNDLLRIAQNRPDLLREL